MRIIKFLQWSTTPPNRFVNCEACFRGLRLWLLRRSRLSWFGRINKYNPSIQKFSIHSFSCLFSFFYGCISYKSKSLRSSRGSVSYHLSCIIIKMTEGQPQRTTSKIRILELSTVKIMKRNEMLIITFHQLPKRRKCFGKFFICCQSWKTCSKFQIQENACYWNFKMVHTKFKYFAVC